MGNAPRVLSVEEVAKHKSHGDAWLIINENVWDVSSFASIHPGGEEIITENFGRDASEVYNEIHGPGLIQEFLGEAKKIGKVTTTALSQQLPRSKAKLKGPLPELDEIINLHDLHLAASKSLNERAWVYVSGATNDCFTRDLNAECYRKVWMRPRVLRPIQHASCNTTFLGAELGIPVFNSPASLSMIVHTDAEVALAKGLASRGSTIIIPTMASYSIGEIKDALPTEHPFFFQLYVSSDKASTKILLDNAVRSGARAIMVTVDLPVMSKREENERYAIRMKRAQKQKKDSIEADGQIQPRGSSQAVDPNLSWKDIRWFKKYTGLPIFIKGVQSVEDALMAYENGCAGIYISNHGGRALDTAPPSLVTLAEIRAKHPELLQKMEVLIDGGIRRGTDILKAFCLGANAVCMGRPFFYALMYGQKGVERVLDSEFS